MSEMYKRIKELCVIRGISITAMCNQASVKRSCLSELNAGRTKKLSSDNVDKIAKFFNVSTDYILGNEDTKKEPSVLDDSKNEIIDKIVTRLCSLSDDNQKKVLDYIELLSLKESQ